MLHQADGWFSGVWLVSKYETGIRTIDSKLPPLTAAGRPIYENNLVTGKKLKLRNHMTRCANRNPAHDLSAVSNADPADSTQITLVHERTSTKHHAPGFYPGRGITPSGVNENDRSKKWQKSKVRAWVERVFAVMKLRFGFAKAKYKGLDKNAHHPFLSCALVNMALGRRVLLKQATV